MAKGSNKEERKRRKLQRGWPEGREGRSSEGAKPSGIEITKCVRRERKTPRIIWQGQKGSSCSAGRQCQKPNVIVNESAGEKPISVAGV